MGKREEPDLNELAANIVERATQDDESEKEPQSSDDESRDSSDSSRR